MHFTRAGRGLVLVCIFLGKPLGAVSPLPLLPLHAPPCSHACLSLPGSSLPSIFYLPSNPSLGTGTQRACRIPASSPSEPGGERDRAVTPSSHVTLLTGGGACGVCSEDGRNQSREVRAQVSEGLAGVDVPRKEKGKPRHFGDSWQHRVSMWFCLASRERGWGDC